MKNETIPALHIRRVDIHARPRIAKPESRVFPVYPRALHHDEHSPG